MVQFFFTCMYYYRYFFFFSSARNLKRPKTLGHSLTRLTFVHVHTYFVQGTLIYIL